MRDAFYRLHNRPSLKVSKVWKNRRLSFDDCVSLESNLFVTLFVPHLGIVSQVYYIINKIDRKVS